MEWLFVITGVITYFVVGILLAKLTFNYSDVVDKMSNTYKFELGLIILFWPIASSFIILGATCFVIGNIITMKKK